MIVVDTGVLFAAADRRDAHHAASAAFLDAQDSEQLILPVPVVVEAAWLIGDRLGAPVEAAFLASVADGEFRRHDLGDADWSRVANLVKRYADLDLGVVDAAVVATAEALGATTLATLNHRDFRVVPPAHTAAFGSTWSPDRACCNPRGIPSQRRTIVMAIHEPGSAREVADQVALIADGRTVESSPPGQVLGDPRDTRTRALLGKVVQAGRL